MNILKKLALSGLALSMASVASAASISGSTDFRVTLPEILVLYHWDDAHLTLTDVATTPENDSDPREISDTTSHDLTAGLNNSPYLITGDVATATPDNANVLDGTVDVTLQNSWAVRSLSSDDVTLALTIQNPTLKNTTDDTSTITVQDATLTATSASSGSGSANVKIPSGWEPVMGDIKFSLDLSDANTSGEYNTRAQAGAAPSVTAADEASDTFLLTLTGNN